MRRYWRAEERHDGDGFLYLFVGINIQLFNTELCDYRRFVFFLHQR